MNIRLGKDYNVYLYPNLELCNLIVCQQVQYFSGNIQRRLDAGIDGVFFVAQNRKVLDLDWLDDFVTISIYRTYGIKKVHKNTIGEYQFRT